ncbi:structure-specific recognition protein-domain-containing protein [Gautieria morchelliformis]|nr:structure-specific recognition protein-domain-containing protein [Gautieria morchelliformis]
MAQQIDNIYSGLSPEVGKLRIGPQGVAWKPLEGDGDAKSVMVPAADIKWAEWLRVARNFQLRIGLKEKGKRVTFDGFVKEEHDKILALMKQHFSVTVETKEITFKGWNWGATDFQGPDLAFLVSNRTSFELPLQSVANSNIAGKTEVSLEFTSAPDIKGAKKAKPVDELVEMRFYIPGTHTKEGSENKGSDDEDEVEMSAAQAFHDTIKEKAEIGKVIGETLVSFDEVLVTTPRGRYDIDMFPTFLRLRGKTYDYKVLYTSIIRLFLLPKFDENHIQFIVALDPPIRQGQTKYPYLVMLFNKEEELDLELNIDAETFERDYKGKLEQKYESPTFTVVSEVFKGLTGKKITAASSSYESKDGLPGFKAHLKAVSGELYFLEKYFFFVSKQPTLIELSDIHQVIFSRVGGAMTSARTFDLKIEQKSGPEYTFTSIAREEHESIESFLKSKKVRVTNEMGDGDAIMAAPDDDSDDEMQSVASSGEEAPKPRLGDEDEDSEEDEDFEASSSDAGSPSDSDSSDSGAASDASGDAEIRTKKKPSGKGDAAKKVPQKKTSVDGDAKAKPKKKKPKVEDSMDVDEAPKAKPKPKKAAVGEDGPPKKKVKKE